MSSKSIIAPTVYQIPGATGSLGERITGRAGVSPAQKEDAKYSLVAGETPAPPVGGLSRKTVDRPWIFLLKQLCHRHIAEAVG